MICCGVCGCENGVIYRPSKGKQFLCDYCNWETPRKVDKESFCKAFFNTTPDNIARSMLNEFYDDYRTSTCNLKEYVDSCTMRE